jgi:hypothetical protein
MPRPSPSLDAQAERAALVAKLEAALVERYIIKRAPVTVGDVTIGRTEYRFRGDTSRVAFTESTFRLGDGHQQPLGRPFDGRRGRGTQLEGAARLRQRGLQTHGLAGGVGARCEDAGLRAEPGDLEVLKRERESRLVNRIEPARDAGGDKAAAQPNREGSARGGGGRKAVLAAIEAVLVAKKVPEKQREAVMAAATEKLAQRLRDGQAPKVKVYDKAAPSQRPVVVPMPEVQRTRERAAPAR